MPPVHHTDLEQYVRNYNRTRYRLMASGRCQVTEARWNAFETSIDFHFPQEFREFSLSTLGGLYFEVLDDLWPRPPITDPLEWQSLYSVKVFGIAVGIPPWLDLREELALLPKQETDLVPIMALGDDPQRYCFDLDEQIILYSPSSGRRKRIKETFYSLLMREIDELEVRRKRLMEGPRPKKQRARKKA